MAPNLKEAGPAQKQQSSSPALGILSLRVPPVFVNFLSALSRFVSTPVVDLCYSTVFDFFLNFSPCLRCTGGFIPPVYPNIGPIIYRSSSRLTTRFFFRMIMTVLLEFSRFHDSTKTVSQLDIVCSMICVNPILSGSCICWYRVDAVSFRGCLVG